MVVLGRFIPIVLMEMVELGDNASVVYPDENSISEAKTDIEAVTMGEEPPYVISQ